MISISIIGSGNVAQHLIKAVSKSANLELVQVFARTKENLESLVEPSKIISDYTAFKAADLYLIAVSDNAIAEVSNHLLFNNQLVAHTSGSCALTDLNGNNRRAVFYPLQTFSKNKAVDFSIVPICLEAEQTDDYQVLEQVAHSISNAVFSIDSEQRKSLHVAAVFVSNFVNHLYQLGNELCDTYKVPFDILKPLITETANKIQTLSPQEAQTGPAKRNDTITINKHLALLTDENHKEIYKILTKSIIDHGKKL
jgi:predicted short-subunit dehydrogenase-like oxidoreductase (DUF2520 family)